MSLLSPFKSTLKSDPDVSSASLSSCFDQQYLQSFEASTFTKRQPFPWYNFQALLTDEAFAQLYEEFPSLDFFETHEGLPRRYGQRSHDRYYLAYEETIYEGDKAQEKGIIRHEQLSPAWQAFMTGLQTDPGYLSFVSRLLGTRRFTTRYAWHVATTGRSVSPHTDSIEKIGTHIFYFNTSEDWRAEWGGSTLVLSGKQCKDLNPEISDFEKVEAVQVMDNRSFLFKNQPDAWHAVDTIDCPPGTHRRIFNVIFELTKADRLKQRLLNRLLMKASRGRLSYPRRRLN